MPVKKFGGDVAFSGACGKGKGGGGMGLRLWRREGGGGKGVWGGKEMGCLGRVG
jgi:hypothetical protein